MEYTIIGDDTLNGLIYEVNQKIREGWLPLGSHVLTQVDHMWFTQAMIRKKPASSPPKTDLDFMCNYEEP